MRHSHRSSPAIINNRRVNNKNFLDVKTGILRFLSVVNIILYSVSVGLEATRPYVGQGIWGSSIHMISGLIGYGTSYRPTKIRLTFVLGFSSLSIMFGLIVSGLSWAGYTDCVYYDPSASDLDDCQGPVSQLALMIVNIIAMFDSIAVALVVSRTLCSSSIHQTRNSLRDSPSVPIATIHAPTSPTTVPDLPGRTTAVVSPNGNIHFISSHRPEMEILARLAVSNELAQMVQRRQEEEERPPRYSIVVAVSEQLDTPEIEMHENHSF